MASVDSGDRRAPVPGTLALLLGVSALLMSFSLLMAGTGLFTTFLSLRAGLEGFSTNAIGYMTAAYYAGLIVGSLRCGPVINRVGHIRAFAAFSSIIAASVLVFPFFNEAPVWIVLRAVIGFNVAGVFMITESWLNHRASPATRGTLLSMYMVTSYLALGAGQLLINAGEIAGADLFMLASILFGLALVPVALTRATHPAPVESAELDVRRLYRISPVATVTCVGSGLCVGSLWGLGPVFGSDLGMTKTEVSAFMSVVVLSALAFQVPIGRLSDRFDRRKVILGVCIAGTLASAALVAMLLTFSFGMPFSLGNRAVAWAQHPWTITLVAAMFAGLTSTLYPLSVAYANDYVEARDLMSTSAGLVLSFGVGAAAGPIPASWLMQTFGPGGLFWFMTGVGALLIGFVTYRMRRRARVPVAAKDSFVALPEVSTTPSPLEADPRSEQAPPDGRPLWMSILDRRARPRER